MAKIVLDMVTFDGETLEGVANEMIEMAGAEGVEIRVVKSGNAAGSVEFTGSEEALAAVKEIYDYESSYEGDSDELEAIDAKDAYDVESQDADWASVLAGTETCACGRRVEVWKSPNGDYTVRLEEGTEIEHED